MVTTTTQTQWKAGAEAIAALIKTVDEVAKVHVGGDRIETIFDLFEYAMDLSADLVEELQPKISVWTIRRIGLRYDQGKLPPSQRYRVHSLLIHGLYGEGTGSDEAFQAILDKVADALEGVIDLPRVTDRYDLIEISSITFSPIGFSLIGPYSCHSVEGRLEMREIVKSALRSAV